MIPSGWTKSFFMRKYLRFIRSLFFFNTPQS
ncbi:hypothetical protein [Bacillus stercoris]